MGSNITLKHIAEELGVSTMTVSRALNNHENVDDRTRKKVVEKAKSMGYTPNLVAKSLVSKKTYSIGVIIPEISHMFFAQVVKGIDDITYRQEYQLILTISAEDIDREKKALQTLRSKRVDGILVSCSESTGDFSHFKEVIDSGTPMVFFDRCITGVGASTVSVNDKEGSKRITQHMIDHGYKRIAYLHGPEVSVGLDRLNGFREALSESNIPERKNLILESGYLEQGGYGAMQKLLKLPEEHRPDCVIAVNDPVAIGAVECMREHSISIPDDIAIAGFSDDIRAGLMECPLTSVKQPAEKIGREATKKLIKTIQNSDESPEDIELNTELMIRQSCGC